jgi:hypothetical protein
MSNTHTQSQSLAEGQVFVSNGSLVPIYQDSSFYVENGLVIPDGVNWLKAISNNGTFGVHSSEMHLLRKAKNLRGEDVYTIRYEYSLVEANDRNGNRVYFLSEEAAEANNFKFSFRLGQFHDAECERFYGDEKLLSYHTSATAINRSKLPKFHDENDEYLLGLEVEKCDSVLQQSGDAWQLLEQTGWSKERDGSLGSGGYEMVSPILPLFNTTKIEQVCESVKKWINGSSDDKCGGHITISKKTLTGDELLESFKQFAPIIYSLYPNRLTNTYCRAKTWSKYFSYNEKYQSFYIKDRNSIGGRVEIRLPNRVRNLSTLLWRVKLIQSLIKDGGNLNQFAQKIGCPESTLYKQFAEQYRHEQIGEKLVLIDKYAKLYGTHRNGISLSVKKRINNTMGYEVFNINESNS